MRLVRFRAKRIHGYLDFDIKFNPDLSFITGINGSGKTTALNSIVALLSADLMALAQLEYKSLSLTIELDGERRNFEAENLDYMVRLYSAEIGESVTYGKHAPDEDLPLSKAREIENTYYRELATQFALHPVFVALNTLPKTMFLGLDRRSRLDEDLWRRSQSYYRSRRTPFSGSLARSFDDAVDLAEGAFRSAVFESSHLADRIQREVLLSLLEFDPSEDHGYGHVTMPGPKDLRDLEELNKAIDTLPQLLGLTAQQVQQRVKPFLNQMRKDAEAIPQGQAIENIAQKSPELLSSLLRWSANQSHLKRIKSISQVVQKFNKQRAEIMKKSSDYALLLNQFLGDSGKTVQFDDGVLVIEVQGTDDRKSISSLSSGEAQIFVILTHLSFNPMAQKNLFIIDEPELSLHVQWQELFVDSLLSANPNIQYILATHSPSIILDRISNCIDISRPKPLRRLKDLT